MTATRGFIKNAATTPQDARLMDLGRVVCDAGGVPRTGVLSPNVANLLAALGTMEVAVAVAVFATSRTRLDGVAIFANDGVVNVPITAAPVSNSRITVIWVKHNDDTQGDANALPVFGTTDGAAAGSPTKPAIPTGAEELGTLRVYSGTTAANGGANVLTQTFRMTAMAGGTVTLRDLAERNAWTNAVDGQLAFVRSVDALYHYLATAPTPGWYHVAGAPEIVAVTPGSSIVAATGGLNQGGVPQLRRQSGLVIGAGALINTGTYAVALGTSYDIATISDASFWPDVDRFFATGTTSNAAAGVVKVSALGVISWRANAAASWASGTLRIDLGGIVYTAKGLG